MRADKGDIHLALIPVLVQAAHEFDTDVVLVTRGRRAHAAAQWARSHYLEHQLSGDRLQLWDLGDHGSELAETAAKLLYQIRQSNLVLFLGAGGERGAGFPVWQDLLDD